MPRPSDVTLLLGRVNRGEDGAADELFGIIYVELRKVAGQLMRGERQEHTLQATALVHELWLRLIGPSGGEQGSGASGEWEGSVHFLRTAARAMRNLLVDHARARRTAKRGGDYERQAIDEMLATYDDRGIDLVELNDALEELSSMDPQLAKLVELRFFGGLGTTETANVLGMSVRSCERAWFSARAFLRTQLSVDL